MDCLQTKISRSPLEGTRGTSAKPSFPTMTTASSPSLPPKRSFKANAIQEWRFINGMPLYWALLTLLLISFMALVLYYLYRRHRRSRRQVRRGGPSEADDLNPLLVELPPPVEEEENAEGMPQEARRPWLNWPSRFFATQRGGPASRHAPRPTDVEGDSPELRPRSRAGGDVAPAGGAARSPPAPPPHPLVENSPLTQGHAPPMGGPLSSPRPLPRAIDDAGGGLSKPPSVVDGRGARQGPGKGGPRKDLYHPNHEGGFRHSGRGRRGRHGGRRGYTEPWQPVACAAPPCPPGGISGEESAAPSGEPPSRDFHPPLPDNDEDDESSDSTNEPPNSASQLTRNYSSSNTNTNRHAAGNAYLEEGSYLADELVLPNDGMPSYYPHVGGNGLHGNLFYEITEAKKMERN